MPRQKIYFGPYILLQTLGEGEFGKVKLGIHSERWGEEVAIKLIKRGNVDTAQRGEKVRREIEVLKVRNWYFHRDLSLTLLTAVCEAP
jgi:serine/threonine protein kinase